MAFASLRCSQGAESRQHSEAVAQRILQEFYRVEEGSQFSEQLSPSVLAIHNKNIEYVRELIPEGYPEPYLPYGLLRDPSVDLALVQRPFLNEKVVALGKKLFFDHRLSYSSKTNSPGETSCASCHHEDLQFTDGLSVSQGVEGHSTRRSSPTLINSAYASTLTWANPAFPVLELQAQIPLFGDDPIEMGLKGREQETLETLFFEDSEYRNLVQQAFNLLYPADLQKGLIDYNTITFALAAYERTLIHFDTRFDRFIQGRGELSDQEAMGLELFFGFKPLSSGETLPCAQCHNGFLLSDSFHYVREEKYFNRKEFHNTGMYNLDGKGSYPFKNTGFATAGQLAKEPNLMGQFRTPTLRFVGQTAPYGHDGSLPSLESVILHYAAGGKASLSEYGQNPYVDAKIGAGFSIESREVDMLASFLRALQ